MNKFTLPLLAGCMLLNSAAVLAAPFSTIKEDCAQESIYTDYVCDGIQDKRDFYDKWYRPPLPFYYTTIESEELPENAWISPDFDPESLETGEEQITGGATVDEGTDVEGSCPPNC